MVEGIVATGPSYDDLIREAFIDPIRTVVVVDDEFPTLDALLDKELNGQKSRDWKKDDVRLARRMVEFCRNSERRWMLEISDGWLPPPANDSLGVSHLHHSDLMILDYHLDGTNSPTDGTLAIDILRKLARNDHFNLVVVYTKGYGGAGNDIERVTKEITVGLCTYDVRLTQNEPLLNGVAGAIEKWEESDDAVKDRLMSAIDDGVYLAIRQERDAIKWNELVVRSEIERLRKLVDQAPANSKISIVPVLKWALHNRQELLRNKLMSGNGDHIAWHWDPSGLNWIRTDRLFVTVIGKSCEPDTIPDNLLAALRRWNPPPHRLLMSKMRAVLDDRGVLAEGEVLGDRLLQRGWLREFLTENSGERIWKIHRTIARHWDGMADAIRNDILGFAEQLADCLIREGRNKVIEVHAPLVPDADEGDVTCAVNRYACSKPVDGHHLTTGHVLRIPAKKGAPEYWLCLSPACDLVPNRDRSGWRRRLGSYAPFTAVRLFSCDIEAGLSQAAAGGNLFLNIDGSTTVLGLAETSLNRSYAQQTAAPNPKWEQMLAAAEGVFKSGFELDILRLCEKPEASLAFEQTTARVVAQLRYEYALNLLQRLGMNLSRIGLDFVSFQAEDKDGQADA